MISGGLSDRTVARLMRLEMLGALDDSDASADIRAFLDRRRRDDEADRSLDLVKMIQAFANPSMYAKVYEDEIHESEQRRQVVPDAASLEKTRRMLRMFSHEDSDHGRREEWTHGGQIR